MSSTAGTWPPLFREASPHRLVHSGRATHVQENGFAQEFVVPPPADEKGASAATPTTMKTMPDNALFCKKDCGEERQWYS